MTKQQVPVLESKKFNPRGVQTPLGRKWLCKISRQEEESGWRWVASRTRHVSAEKFAAVGSRQQVASHTAAQPSFESNRSIFLLAYWLPRACFSSDYFTGVRERAVPEDTCLSSTSGHRNATLVGYADFRNDHALHRREIGYRSRVQKKERSLKRIGVVWLGLRVFSAVCVSDRVFYYAFLEPERSVKQCLRKFEHLDYKRQRFEEVDACGK